MNAPVPEPDQVYLLLRSRIMSLTPGDVGISPSEKAPNVWGVIMETGYEVGSATLVSLADGTTSLNFSTGGGMLGRGDYPPVSEASRALIQEAEGHLSELPLSTDRSLPGVGEVRFTFLTYSGLRSEGIPEEDLIHKHHPLFNLYTRAQTVLSQLRQSAEKKRT